MKKLLWFALFIGVISLVYWGSASLNDTSSKETQYTADEIRRAVAEGRVVVVSPPDEQGKMLIRILPEAPPVVEEPEVSSQPTTTKRIYITTDEWDALERQAQEREEEFRRRNLDVRISDLQKKLGIPGTPDLFYTQEDLARKADDLERKLYWWGGSAPDHFNSMEQLERRVHDMEKDLYWWK